MLRGVWRENRHLIEVGGVFIWVSDVWDLCFGIWKGKSFVRSLWFIDRTVNALSRTMRTMPTFSDWIYRIEMNHGWCSSIAPPVWNLLVDFLWATMITPLFSRVALVLLFDWVLTCGAQVSLMAYHTSGVTDVSRLCVLFSDLGDRKTTNVLYQRK